VPRHANNDPQFITATLENLGVRHDKLMDRVESVANEDPFAALRLMYVCGVQRFGHILSAVPPPLVADFAALRDDAVTSTFATIQQEQPLPDSSHCLPIGACGASFTSLARHTKGSYLGAFFRVSGPLQQRIVAMGGITNRTIGARLMDPAAASATQDWAAHGCAAHEEAMQMQHSFTPEEHGTTNFIAPRGNTITYVGDPTSVTQDLLPTIHTNVTLPLWDATEAPKGVRFVAAGLRKLSE